MRLPSRFTHDAVRAGGSVWVCDTERGNVLELSWPGLRRGRTLPLFTKKDHVNTLAPSADGTALWAVLHNLGQVS